MKIAENDEKAWDMQETYKGLPHGWIQWKGTRVCMDCYCVCGESFHIDNNFTYAIKCKKCNRMYMVNGHVEFIEIKECSHNCISEGDE